MDFYRKAPVWEQQHDCPNTTKLAKPIKPLKVKNARVIEVVDAKYRGSIFSGTFLLGDRALILDGKNRSTRVEVLCKWFGHRLATRGLAFTVNLKKTRVHDKYTGEVFSDFSKQLDQLNCGFKLIWTAVEISCSGADVAMSGQALQYMNRRAFIGKPS